MQIPLEQWSDAIEKAGGVTHGIAKILGVSRQTVYNHAKKNPEIANLIADQQQVCIDIAMMNMREHIESGDPKMIMWYLDRKGKDLGFGRTLDLNAKVDMQAKIVLYMPNDGRETNSDASNGTTDHGS